MDYNNVLREDVYANAVNKGNKTAQLIYNKAEINPSTNKKYYNKGNLKNTDMLGTEKK